MDRIAKPVAAFRDGLNDGFGLFTLLKANLSEETKVLFTSNNQDVTAIDVQNIFLLQDVDSQALDHWLKYLDYLQSK